MPLFIEHLIDPDQDHRWAIQVMQHALSLHSHLPLRLFDRKKIKPLFSSEFYWDNGAHNNLMAILNKLTEKNIKDLDNRKLSPWVTIPSNIHPLIRYLRVHSFWRAAEQYLVCNWLHSLNGTSSTINYFHKSMCISACHLEIENINNFDGFLVVGPLFMPPEIESDEIFLNENIKLFVSSLMSSLRNRKIKGRYVKQEMELLGTSRGWISESSLIDKTEFLGNLIKNLFSMECEIPNEINLERCTYNSIAQLFFLFHRPEFKIIIKNFDRKATKAIFFNLVQVSQENLKFLNENYVLKFKNNKFMIKESQLLENRRIWIEYNEKSSAVSQSDQFLVKSFDNSWQDLIFSYATLHHGYTNDTLMRFWNWLNDEFGLVSATSTESKNDDAVPMYQRIAREITLLFTADVCTIYLYNYSFKILEHQVSTFQEKLVDTARRDWTRALKEVMKKAAEDITGELRKKSICYRCADKKQSRFCRAWDEKNNRSYPENEPFLNPDPNLDHKPYKSVIAVPMIVNRRLFGVLEIAGFSPYQFRFANLNLAQHVGNVLGAFLHHKEVLAALHGLSKVILDHRVDDKVKFDKICEEFAKFFFADAAVFYKSKSGEQGVYELAGWHNREHLDQSKNKLENLNEEVDDSPLMIALKSGEWRTINTIKELKRKWPGWINKFINRQDLWQFDWQVGIPVRISHGISEKINLGGLYLYYRNHPKEENVRPLLEGWELTVKFLADYVALLVEAMESQKKMLQSHMIQHMLRHELKQTVESVSQTAKDIVQFIRRNSQKLPKTISEEVRCKYKDLSSSQKLLREMIDMLQVESFEKLVTHGLDPVLYLVTEGGKIKINESTERINIHNLFKELWEGVNNNKENSGKKISYEFSGPNSDYSIKANKRVVRLIFDNLFINAAKYSINGSHIEARIDDKPEYSIIIHLLNQAPSLSHGEYDSIFKYRFRGSNVGRKKGDGLGLTVAKRLCQVLNGTLKVDIKEIDDGNSNFDFQVILPKILQV
jgi:signal transduction histidine kinase